MVKVRKDLTGQQFGRLTVLYQTEDHINVNNKRIHLGYSDDLNEAIKIRKEAEKYYWQNK